MMRRLAAVCVVLAAVATSSVAHAICTPAADTTPLPASGTTVTCSGTTTDQNAGANAGYGTGNQTGVTVNVVAGSGNTVNGTTYGVYLGDATATNGAAAGITGGGYGVYANTGFANVTNSGDITGTTGYGIFGSTNATVTNNVGASITGGDSGIVGNTGFADVTNSGSITGTSYAGIYGGTNATVTNNTGASITGGQFGISGATIVTVTNNAGASITGGDIGIRTFGSSSNVTVTVTNSGSITGTNMSGIEGLVATVTNNAGASITGGLYGIRTLGQAHVTNSGSITGTAGYGIYGSGGATVTNNAGASIIGGDVGIRGFGATVTNSGSIEGTSSYGIWGTIRATVTNNAGGSITGGDTGVLAGGGGSSVFNAGTISGGTAAIQFTGVGNTLTLAPGSVIIGNVLGTGSNTFQLGGTGAATFDVSQLGAAAQYRGFGTFNKIDSSAWTLTGTSTFAGPINVNGGTLSVNGNVTSASGVTVNGGGALMGTGTVGNTSIAGGIFMPGSGTPGSSMTVNGTLGFNAASAYVVNLNPATSSFVNVSGTATLGGAAVNAFFANGSSFSKQYTILTASSVSGTFNPTVVNFNLPPNFTDTLSYDATHAYLNLMLNFSTPAAGTLNGNQNAVGNALSRFFDTTGGISSVFGLLNANGLLQASGETGAAVAQTGITAMGQFINAIYDGAFDDNSGPGATSFAEENAYAAEPKVSREAKDAYAAVTPRDRRAPLFEARWSVWATAYGGNARVNGDAMAGTNTATSRIFGTAVGASYRFAPDTQAGFALGGAGSSFNLDGGFGGGKADVFNAAGYAKHNWGPAYLAGLLGYSWQDTTTDRTVTIAGTDNLHAAFKTQALFGRLEGGWRYATPMVGITPYAALQATSFYLPSYGETATSGNNTFALNYASKTVTATRSELGAKFDKAMLMQGGTFTLKAKAAWAHDWNTDRTATATFQALPGATFTVNGAQPSADAALTSLGAEMKWRNGWTLAASVDGEFSRTTAAYSGKGSLRYAW